MLGLDFMVKSRLKLLKGISVECIKCPNKDAKKKMDRSCTLGVGMIKSLLVLNCLILSMSFMDSVVIFIEIIN